MVSVLTVASAIIIGVYFYLNTDETREEATPAAATISESVKPQPDAQKPDQKTQKETKKPAPELKSFEGLDEESSVIFNGEGGSQSPSEDPLKAATQ